MKSSRSFFVLLLSAYALLSSSCAKNYYQLNLNSANYEKGYAQNEVDNEPLQFSYKYGVLSDFGNEDYASKERSKNIDLVAVELTNVSDQPLVLGTHFHIYQSGQPVNFLSKQDVYKKLKQNTPLYFLYLGLSGLNYQETEVEIGTGVSRTTRFIPVGLILGPALAIINVSKSDKSNKIFKADLDRYYLHKNLIEPGETVIGLIGLRQYGGRNLTISYDESMIDF